jgi:hypothetical protein
MPADYCGASAVTIQNNQDNWLKVPIREKHFEEAVG